MVLAGGLGIADRLPAKSEQERAAHKALATFRTSGFGYFLEQSTRKPLSAAVREGPEPHEI
jgi:hypothetical protein